MLVNPFTLTFSPIKRSNLHNDHDYYIRCHKKKNSNTHPRIPTWQSTETTQRTCSPIFILIRALATMCGNDDDHDGDALSRFAHMSSASTRVFLAAAFAKKKGSPPLSSSSALAFAFSCCRFRFALAFPPFRTGNNSKLLFGAAADCLHSARWMASNKECHANAVPRS